MSFLLFHVLNQWLSIHLFGRHVHREREREREIERERESERESERETYAISVYNTGNVSQDSCK